MERASLSTGIGARTLSGVCSPDLPRRRAACARTFGKPCPRPVVRAAGWSMMPLVESDDPVGQCDLLNFIRQLLVVWFIAPSRSRASQRIDRDAEQPTGDLALAPMLRIVVQIFWNRFTHAHHQNVPSAGGGASARLPCLMRRSTVSVLFSPGRRSRSRSATTSLGSRMVISLVCWDTFDMCYALSQRITLPNPQRVMPNAWLPCSE